MNTSGLLALFCILFPYLLVAWQHRQDAKKSTPHTTRPKKPKPYRSLSDLVHTQFLVTDPAGRQVLAARIANLQEKGK